MHRIRINHPKNLTKMFYFVQLILIFMQIKQQLIPRKPTYIFIKHNSVSISLYRNKNNIQSTTQ